ncbi:hypothetical protein [Paenarthrobacter sp. NPDC091669]|uniref:hypothetical protein n=1 Tax=Paenarthrobacter sp. NPDC091669 TaxID=3364384 RepID=UPI0037FF1040
MAMMTIKERTGLLDVLRDNVETWSIRVGAERRKDQRRAFAWYYLVPTTVSLVPVALAITHVHEIRVGGIGPILSGVSIFTGLLFGLLVLMFNTGVAVRKDRAVLENAHGVAQVIDDARANVTYSALVALSLACVLIAAAATNRSSDGVLDWGWTVPLVWLGTHLLLNLLTILKRLRTAFNNITR